MHARIAAFATLLFIVIVVFFAATPIVQADHDKFAYKFPCAPSIPCFLTQQVHVGVSLDFDINGSASSGTIINMAEGTVVDMPIDQFECGAQGLGRQVHLDDIFGRTSIYSHMASFAVGLAIDSQLFQGADIGIEGNTGFAEACAVHLHWQIGNMPQYVDGLEVTSLLEYHYPDPGPGQCTCYYTSSNEVIGDQSIDPVAGFEIDAEYFQWGQWTNIGYVSDVGRGLAMHRSGTGWEQNFASHDDVSGTVSSGIYVPDSDGDDAFWVQPMFWPTYEATGGPTGFLQYPVGEQVLPCPPGGPDPCDTYQDFECGYIWRNGSSTLTQYTSTYEGLYALRTGGTDLYRHLAFGSAGWDDIAGYTPPGSAMNLKVFGDFMVHKEGGVGQTFRVTTDGGETWQQTAKPTDVTSFRPIDADLCSNGRLWLIWQRSTATSTNYVRLYYSDDFGATITLSREMNLSGLNTYASQFNGAVSCHPTDPDRVMAFVQRFTKGRAIVTTDGGGSWL